MTTQHGQPAPAPALLGTATNPRPYQALALVGWLALCFAVAGAGSYAVTAAIPTWYAPLAKPPLTPPNWLFAPVWTLLYTTMAVAAWLGWRTRVSVCRTRVIRLFLVQLLLNLTWTWIFFSRHRPGLALLDMALLWAAIALCTQTLFTISRRAGWLMVPYLAWITFAAYLNAGIWRLNP